MEESVPTEAESLFLTWLSTNGATFPRLIWPSVRQNTNIRSVMARSDIEVDEKMLHIPFNLMMTPIHALRDREIGTVCRENQGLLRGDILLTVYIMHERIKREMSFYWPYLQILPQDPSTAVDWTESEMDELQNPSLKSSLMSSSRTIEALYQYTFHTLNLLHPEIFDLNRYSLHEFWFAWRTIGCRAFGKRLPWSALVPYADLLNHDNLQTKYSFGSDSIDNNVTTNDNVASSIVVHVNAFDDDEDDDNDDDNNDLDLTRTAKQGKKKYDSSIFHLFPTGSNRYQTGKEVFNSYGRRSNDDLLSDYGFCLMNNEWDSIQLKLSMPTHVDHRIQRSHMLVQFGLLPVIKISIPSNSFPSLFLTYQRIMLCPLSDGDQLPTIDMSLPMNDKEVELNAIAKSRELLINEVNKWGSSLSSVSFDEELLTSSFGRLQLALIYRITRKRIMIKAIKILDDLIDLTYK